MHVDMAVLGLEHWHSHGWVWETLPVPPEIYSQTTGHEVIFVAAHSGVSRGIEAL